MADTRCVLGVFPGKRDMALCAVEVSGRGPDARPRILAWQESARALPKVSSYADVARVLAPARDSPSPDLVIVERQLSSNAPLIRIEAMCGMYFHAQGFEVAIEEPKRKLEWPLSAGLVTPSQLERCHNKGMFKRLGTDVVVGWLRASERPEDAQWLRQLMDSKHREALSGAFLTAMTACIPCIPPTETPI